MKTFSRKTVLSEIEQVLAPFIGAGLARASAITQTEKIGLGEDVTFPELQELLDRLGRGLRVFVGQDPRDPELFR